jgi:signal transduction histidine kinase
MLKFKEFSIRPTIHYPSEGKRILVVDDDQLVIAVLNSVFKELYDTRTAESGQQALDILRSGFQPQVIIADQRMPSMTGAEFLAESRKLLPDTVRVVLTGYTDINDVIASINDGYVYRFMTKPWEERTLLETVRLCFEQYELATRHAELQAAYKELSELNTEKNEILGIVSHDLRNPITVISGFAQLLRDDDPPQPKRHNYAHSIYTTSAQMLELVGKLLDVNRLESGKIVPSLIPVDVAECTERLCERYFSRAKAKLLALHYSCEAEQTTVLTDEQLLEQVLDNLISNAVKYSPPNTTIRITIANTVTDSKQHLRISVADQGQGISAEDMPHLFGKFARLSAQPTGGESSTGLGLAIVKKLVELMQGRVWCESSLGNGAVFSVELPKA